jgi:transposase
MIDENSITTIDSPKRLAHLLEHPRMNVLSREEVARIKALSVAKAQLAQYSDLLRTTLAINQKLEERVKELSGQVEMEKQNTLFSKEQINEMRRRMYGDSSERRTDGGSGPLFDAAQAQEAETETVTRKKRTKFGRREQPELPTVEFIHELPGAEALAQGLEKWEGQFEVSQVINVVPTKIVREIHKRQKYRAKAERDPELSPIITAPLVGEPIKVHAGDRYGLEFDIEVALAKYLWHLPLDRQVRMLAAQGLAIESQTLYARINTLSWYLETAVMPRLVAEVQASPVKLGDETTWKNLEKRPGEGEPKKKRFYLWAVRGGRAVCFSVYDGRSGKIAQAFLEGIEGVLLVDGFRGYDCLAGPKLIVARDWVHGRRKFVTAEQSNPKEAAWFIAQMKLLFDIEEEMKEKSPAERAQGRQTRSKPIVDGIREKIEDLAPKTLPKSALGRALAYMQTYWQGLTVFLTHPEVPLHTNTIEGAIRGPVVGRKNHYGSKSLKTGKVAAIFYSIVETCKANGVDPRRYLRQAMIAILTKKPVPMPWDLAERPPKPPPDTVSETAVFETPSRLTTKAAENGPSPASKAVS